MRSPRVSATAIRWFSRYNRFYLARHFSACRVAGLEHLTDELVAEPSPLIVYLTHAAWWDPLVGVLLASGPFAGRHHRAVIDARALERYAILKRLGFVGLDREARQGARSLLKLVDTLGSVERATLWLTPQGRFTDPRRRPVSLAGGLAHIARRLPNARFLPLAIEYPMGGERLPEVRARFGRPESVAALVDTTPVDRPTHTSTTPDGGALGGAAPAAMLTDAFAYRLATVADRLAHEVTNERIDDYTTLLEGAHGVGALYDGGRRLRARLTGRPYTARHGGNLPTR